MKYKHRRIWLGLAALTQGGFLCHYCRQMVESHRDGEAEYECDSLDEYAFKYGPLGEYAAETVYVDCRGFTPRVPFTEAARGALGGVDVREGDARQAWKRIVRERDAKVARLGLAAEGAAVQKEVEEVAGDGRSQDGEALQRVTTAFAAAADTATKAAGAMSYGR